MQIPYPMQGNTSNAPPINLPSERADFLGQIQPGLVVDQIFHRLLGEKLDINGEWKPAPELQNRAFSSMGAWDIATLMTPVSSQNVSLSKLSDKEIRMRTRSIIKTAMIMCLRNWKEYGIKGIDQFHFVHEIIFSNSFITMKQPEGEGIRKMLQNMGSADFTMPQENKGGILDVFKKEI